MTVRTDLYKDWDKVQDDMKKANEMGFDVEVRYNENVNGWYVTYRTLAA